MNVAETDVLIIGAGPIGIELAVALKARGIRYVHLEADQIASTIAWYAPQTHFFSSPERIAIAGVPLQTLDQTKATREEYLTYLRAVVLQFDLRIETFERVTSLHKEGDWFEIASARAAGERLWRARSVVLAIGDMHRPRRINVPGEDLAHVSHYFGDPHQYFRRRVLIVGGQNSAVEAAIRCHRVGAEVTLSYRGSELDEKRIKFWLLPEIRSLIRDGRLQYLPRTIVGEIQGDRVVLDPHGEVQADAVLLLTGYEQDSTLFEQIGIRLEGQGKCPQFDEQTMETNVHGLYVAGTGAAGTQLGGVKEFIETSHVHVARIVAALTRTAPPSEAPSYELPEA
ncbi:MAG TPA: NAD(P)-binding domain-containing protein [Thermoanaerobaculia bacterium]|jgi:thioredoxin reductase (NADPH)|nr:NAD(P)-binding domain-containing protein [Thermoanaerobaculia bacterium]